MLRIEDIWSGWQSFLHSPESPSSLAAFRILWGCLLCLNGMLLVRDLEPFFGPDGYVSAERHRQLFGRSRFSLFLLLPETVGSAKLILGLNLIASIALVLGWYTRTSSVIVYLTLVSLHHRNPCVFHSGDTLMRLMTFLLIFSPAGEMHSLDAWWSHHQGLASHEGGASPSRSPWCIRLMQIQLCLVYLRTVFWKLWGKHWPQGTAAYFPTQLESFQRIRLPRAMCRLGWIRLATWGTLVAETALATLVWFEDTRYMVLLIGVVLHLTFELFLNLQLFSWTMIVCYVIFIPPEATDRFISNCRRGEPTSQNAIQADRLDADSVNPAT